MHGAPPEIWYSVLRQLGDERLVPVLRVCRGWHALAVRIMRGRRANAYESDGALLQRAADLFAAEGRLRLVGWLYAECEGRLSAAALCAAAARAGQCAVLAHAHASGWPWRDARVCEAAAEHLDVLQWARANGCPWDEWTCAYAAAGGHLAVLQWARANGCPWDEWTCAYAAQKGHLAVLQWARANGCPWNEWTCANAAEGGHLAVLQWARANGCLEREWDGRVAMQH